MERKEVSQCDRDVREAHFIINLRKKWFVHFYLHFIKMILIADRLTDLERRQKEVVQETPPLFPDPDENNLPGVYHMSCTTKQTYRQSQNPTCFCLIVTSVYIIYSIY